MVDAVVVAGGAGGGGGRYCGGARGAGGGGERLRRAGARLPHARGERRRGVEEATTHAATGDENPAALVVEGDGGASPKILAACRRPESSSRVCP